MPQIVVYVMGCLIIIGSIVVPIILLKGKPRDAK
jgi:hypothetical protein